MSEESVESHEKKERTLKASSKQGAGAARDSTLETDSRTAGSLELALLPTHFVTPIAPAGAVWNNKCARAWSLVKECVSAAWGRQRCVLKGNAGATARGAEDKRTFTNWLNFWWWPVISLPASPPTTFGRLPPPSGGFEIHFVEPLPR